MARLSHHLPLALTGFALMFTVSACLDSGSRSKSCDPEDDSDCVCTLDEDATDVTGDCIDGSTTDGAACTCELDDPDPEPNPNPSPNPDPGPGPDPGPCADACERLIDCTDQACPGELGLDLDECVEQCEPDPAAFEAERLAGLSCDEINGAVCPEPAPVLINQVARVAWGWKNQDAGNIRSYFARSQPAAFSNLVSEPEPILAILDGRRLIGGDCVAYVEDDLTARSGGGTKPQPIPSQPQSDIGDFNTFFMDTSGDDLFQITHRYDAETRQYGFEDIFEQVDNPSPASGSVRIFAQNRGPIHEESGDTAFSIRNPEPIAWSLRGMESELSTSGDAPAMYIAFDMVGDRARAHVHCASQFSDGAARFTVPDLTELAAEIGWDESREAPGTAFCGVTNISDPLRSGFYGVVEQALNGPEFMFEEINSYSCGFEN